MSLQINVHFKYIKENMNLVFYVLAGVSGKTRRTIF